MISPAVIKATDGGTERYGLYVNNLQDDISITKDAISGKLKLVKSYPQFGDEEANSPWHYLALDMEVPDEATVTTKIEGGDNSNYVDVTEDKFCVYRVKNNEQKIVVRTQVEDRETEIAYDLTDLTLVELIGEEAFDESKVDFGGFGNNSIFYKDSKVNKSWDGTNCTVTGTLNWVLKSSAPKLGSDGNYFAFKLDDYYNGEQITVINGGKEKTRQETDWVCKVSAEKKEIVVKHNDNVIVKFDLSGVELDSAE